MSHIPAVLAPHPGQSYNPENTDYNRLIDKAANAEQDRLEERRKYQQAIHEFKVVDRLPSSSEEEESGDEQTPANQNAGINPPTQNKKKTRKQRNT
jgi:hypothetical protein